MRHLFKPLAVLTLVAFSAADLAAQDSEGFQVLKKNFIDGDWRFMAIVLICLILGLAFCIERIITLNLASTNTDKLLSRI
jgi:biopolymer transport protein ExbB